MSDDNGVCPHWTPDYYTENLAGRMIYKDECGRCFATPKDPDGLNVCLKTLIGACGEHSKVHYKNTSNPLVLNIKMVPK